MNKGLQALVVLTPMMNQVIVEETDPNKNHGLVLPVRRASRDLVRQVDQLSYYRDERCEQPKERIRKEYNESYPMRIGVLRGEVKENIETIRTHRVVSPTGSQLAIYAKWFANNEGGSLDPRYADIIHDYRRLVT